MTFLILLYTTDGDSEFLLVGRDSFAMMAYHEVINDENTGHLVGLGAYSSGPQIMSALMRDIVGAENTYIVGKKKNCVYTKTIRTMNGYLSLSRQDNNAFTPKGLCF